MQISPLEEYSLRCLIRLARTSGEGPVSIRQIGQGEGLSTAYVGKLLYLMQKAGLVQGLRGVQGGYTLLRDPKSLSVGEIFRCINPNAWSTVCEKFTGDLEQCANSGHCGLQPVWGHLAAHIYSYLDSISLDDLAQGRPLPLPAPAQGLAVAALSR